MTKRVPTPEEKKLWRESNRFTRKGVDVPDIVVEEEDQAVLMGEAPKAKAAPATKASSKTKPTVIAPLKPLSPREAARLRKSYADIEATLDLHGLTKLQAYTRVQEFIHAQHRARRRHLLIITGKGRTGEGILRSELPHWLNEPALRPLISAFTHGKPEKGGNGVTHVLVKKYRD